MTGGIGPQGPADNQAMGKDAWAKRMKEKRRKKGMLLCNILDCHESAKTLRYFAFGENELPLKHRSTEKRFATGFRVTFLKNERIQYLK